MAASHTEDQHFGEGERDAETAVHRQHHALTLGAKYGLADEMEDGSLRGKAQYGGPQDALEGGGGTAWRVDGPASLDELTHSATIGERIRKDSTREHNEKSVAANTGELMEDCRCGGAHEDALIDAQKPEGRKEANGRGARGEERFERSGEGRMEKQNSEQEHNGRALKQRRDASKDVLPDDVQEDALKREEGGGRKRSACEHSYGVREQVAEKVGQLSNQRQEQNAENAGAKQHQAEKDSERQHPRKKEIPAGYWLDREDEDIHKIREEEIPLKDRSCAHHDEGVHDIEVVICDLSPERAGHRVRRKGMVGREEKERHYHPWDGNGTTDLHHALGFVVVGAEQFVMKKAVKNVTDKDLELALLPASGEVFGLHGERENSMFGWGEDAGSLTHGEPP